MCAVLCLTTLHGLGLVLWQSLLTALALLALAVLSVECFVCFTMSFGWWCFGLKGVKRLWLHRQVPAVILDFPSPNRPCVLYPSQMHMLLDKHQMKTVEFQVGLPLLSRRRNSLFYTGMNQRPTGYQPWCQHHHHRVFVQMFPRVLCILCNRMRQWKVLLQKVSSCVSIPVQ